MSNELSYSVHHVRTDRIAPDLPAETEDLQWVANSATLIYGQDHAVLVDTYTTIEQNEALIEWVRSFGKTLTHIYITHGHGDHVFGVKQLTEAFPQARAVATAAAVEQTRAASSPEAFAALWEPAFPGQIARPPVLPAVLEGDVIMLEGHRLEIVEAGFTDTAGTSSVWVPDLRLLVAGDVVYDATHLYLLESSPASRQEWIKAVERLRRLDPLTVVAGHSNPEHADLPAALDETIAYLRDYDEAITTSADARGLFRSVLSKYPRLLNPGILSMSAGGEVF